MSLSKTALTLKVRSSATRADPHSFQADVEPHQTYEGRELYERLANFMGFPADSYRARSIVEQLESFIRKELESGNRLDFGLVTFFPKLSGGLPTRDADPTESELYVRGAVKARKSLCATLEEHVVAKNPEAGEPLYTCNVLNETLNEFDIVGTNDTLSIVGLSAIIDPSMPDEGVWLEKPIKRWHQKHIPVARAEILEIKKNQLRCRFTEPLRSRQYNLVIGTRCGAGPTYKLRYVRRLVRAYSK